MCRENQRLIERRSNYKRNYGITIEDYDEMFLEQNGCCAICGTTDPDSKFKHFSVDHCHDTGQVRGLLCNSCNKGLGHFRDNIEVLEAAIQYLINAQIDFKGK